MTQSSAISRRLVNMSSSKYKFDTSKLQRDPIFHILFLLKIQILSYFSNTKYYWFSLLVFKNKQTHTPYLPFTSTTNLIYNQIFMKVAYFGEESLKCENFLLYTQESCLLILHAFCLQYVASPTHAQCLHAKDSHHWHIYIFTFALHWAKLYHQNTEPCRQLQIL